MKKSMFLALALCMATALWGKNLRTLVVTTVPKMHCASCEKKIKDNIRFEKGVKAIATHIGNQTVTIRYDADKNKAENLVKAFAKFGYKAEMLKDTVYVDPKATAK